MAETATLDAALEKALAFLRQRIRIEAAYFFGSQLTGNTHAYSDIDLAVFSSDAENMSFMERVRLGSELALECHPDVEPHLYSSPLSPTLAPRILRVTSSPTGSGWWVLRTRNAGFALEPCAFS